MSFIYVLKETQYQSNTGDVIMTIIVVVLKKGALLFENKTCDCVTSYHVRNKILYFNFVD